MIEVSENREHTLEVGLKTIRQGGNGGFVRIQVWCEEARYIIQLLEEGNMLKRKISDTLVSIFGVVFLILLLLGAAIGGLLLYGLVKGN